MDPDPSRTDGDPASSDAPVTPDASDASDAPVAPDGSDAPDAPDSSDAPDATLGGYLELHNRPPGFEGVDGQPYTVSIEVERTANLRAPWSAWLLFPRWAETGLGIIGHVETPVLWEGTSREEAVALAGEALLLRVKTLLDEAIRRRAEASEGE